MDLSDLRNLSDKDLAIYNGELSKRRRSTGVAYVLLLFFGGLGAHKFYLGRWGGGIIYICLTGLAGMCFLSTIVLAASKESSSTGAAAGSWMFFVFIAGLFAFIDLITLPMQTAQTNDRAGKKIIDALKLG